MKCKLTNDVFDGINSTEFTVYVDGEFHYECSTKSALQECIESLLNRDYDKARIDVMETTNRRLKVE